MACWFGTICKECLQLPSIRPRHRARCSICMGSTLQDRGCASTATMVGTLVSMGLFGIDGMACPCAYLSWNSGMRHVCMREASYVRQPFPAASRRQPQHSKGHKRVAALLWHLWAMSYVLFQSMPCSDCTSSLLYRAICLGPALCSKTCLEGRSTCRRWWIQLAVVMEGAGKG